MDAAWRNEVSGLTTKEQWDTLYEKKKKVQQNGRSIWGKNDVYKNSALLVDLLPDILIDLKIKSFVDIGCGDFLWLSKLDWSEITYTGIDIVQGLVDENKKMYSKFNFECKNLIVDDCPNADMIFMRSVLIHTSIGDCFKIIDTIKKSGSKYLCVSSLPQIDKNIDTTCLWLVQRNLEIEPFNFPKPIYLLPEIKKDGINNYMGIWEIDKL